MNETEWRRWFEDVEPAEVEFRCCENGHAWAVILYREEKEPEPDDWGHGRKCQVCGKPAESGPIALGLNGTEDARVIASEAWGACETLEPQPWLVGIIDPGELEWRERNRR